MHFYYDAQGRPAVVDFNCNIVGMLDSSENLVVEYRYDT